MNRVSTNAPATQHPLSVIIPALNEERFLPRLLSSLVECRNRSLEIIVVDGRSEDRTLEVVEAFRRSARSNVRIRAVCSDVRNVSYQRNLGAGLASHELLMFLDADTELPSAHQLDRLIDRFTNGDYVVASCRFRPAERDLRGELYYGFLYAFQKSVSRLSPYALGACILTRRATFARCGGFDATIRVNEDAHFCLAASRYGRFGLFPYPMRISTRRFAKHGYLRMGIQYLAIFANRTLNGELRDDRFRYEFGNYS